MPYESSNYIPGIAGMPDKKKRIKLDSKDGVREHSEGMMEFEPKDSSALVRLIGGVSTKAKATFDRLWYRYVDFDPNDKYDPLG